MERSEGRCWLDWWANSVTNLGGNEVSVTITPTETGWDAYGQLNNDDELEGFIFLYDLDPVFTLRFQDDSTVGVIVTATDDCRFTLAEYTGPTTRQIDYRLDL